MLSSQLDDMADEFPMNPFMTDSNLNNNNNNNNMNMGTMNTPVPAFAQQPSMMQNQNVQQQQQFQPPTLEQPPPFVPPSSSTDLNSSSTTFSGNMDNNNNNNNNNNGGGMTVPVPKCCSFETYAQYFNVDTIDIKTRIVGAIQFANIPDHFRNNILNQEGKGPDLYGPTWITMTLVFFVAVSFYILIIIHVLFIKKFLPSEL